MSLTFTRETVGTDLPAVVLSLAGEVETASAESLDEAMRSVLDRSKLPLVIDLQAVSYVSSSGWCVFIDRIHHLAPEQRLKVCGMSETVRDVFDLLGLSAIIEAHHSVAEAVAALRGVAARPR